MFSTKCCQQCPVQSGSLRNIKALLVLSSLLAPGQWPGALPLNASFRLQGVEPPGEEGKEKEGISIEGMGGCQCFNPSSRRQALHIVPCIISKPYTHAGCSIGMILFIEFKFSLRRAIYQLNQLFALSHDHQLNRSSDLLV